MKQPFDILLVRALLEQVVAQYQKIQTTNGKPVHDKGAPFLGYDSNDATKGIELYPDSIRRVIADSDAWKASKLDGLPNTDEHFSVYRRHVKPPECNPAYLDMYARFVGFEDLKDFEKSLHPEPTEAPASKPVAARSRWMSMLLACSVVLLCGVLYLYNLHRPFHGFAPRYGQVPLYFASASDDKLWRAPRFDFYATLSKDVFWVEAHYIYKKENSNEPDSTRVLEGKAIKYGHFMRINLDVKSGKKDYDGWHAKFLIPNANDGIDKMLQSKKGWYGMGGGVSGHMDKGKNSEAISNFSNQIMILNHQDPTVPDTAVLQDLSEHQEWQDTYKTRIGLKLNGASR
jgi:hypothetical protein